MPLDKYAEKYGVCPATIDNWIAAGVDIENEDEVNAIRDMPQGAGEGDENNPFVLLRKRKLAAEATLKEHQAERERLRVQQTKGGLIAVEEVQKAAQKIAHITKAHLLKLEGELPPMLEGLSAAEMQTVIRSKIDEVLGELSGEQLWTE